METPAAPVEPAAPAAPAPAEPAPSPTPGPSVVPSQTPAAPTPTSPTPTSPTYEATFGKILNPDGTLRDGWASEFPEFDEGRRERLSRQTDFKGLVKALSSAQDHIEKRDGAGRFIPDPSNEAAVREYRTQNSIPTDLSDPAQAYDLTGGVEFPEGFFENQEERDAHMKGLHDAVAPILQKHNLSRDAVSELSKAMNEFQVNLYKSSVEHGAKAQAQHEEQVVAKFKKEWGMDYDRRAERVGLMHEALGFDPNDPRDYAAMTNPKVISALEELGVYRRSTGTTPEGKPAGNHTMHPKDQAKKIMAENPNWQRVPHLERQVVGLLEMSKTLKERG
jgi:hypothetical protein